MATTKKAVQKSAEPSATFKKLCKKYGVDHTNVPEILSLEDACKALGKAVPKIKITGAPKEHISRMITDCELSIIAEAINKKRQPNYSDNSEYKAFPYFLVKADAKRPSGFGLSFCDDDGWCSRSDVGVRLCFPHEKWEVARDRAIFFGKHFLKMHEVHHLYK